MDPSLFEVVVGSGPIVATAIHDGHALRPDCAAAMVLDEAPRLREEVAVGGGPLVGTAMLDGHGLRPDCAAAMVLDEATRLREEDPFTAGFAAVAPTRLVAKRSRFEVDLNRPRDQAVYTCAEDAW